MKHALALDPTYLRRLANPLITLLLLHTAIASGMSNRKANEIPVPPENFTCRLTDRLNMETVVTNASIEGETFLTCWRGAGKLFIPFEKIRSIQFGIIDDDGVRSMVTLSDQTVLDVTINPRLTCYGSTPFGEYSIKMSEIKVIEILERQTEGDGEGEEQSKPRQ